MSQRNLWQLDSFLVVVMEYETDLKQLSLIFSAVVNKRKGLEVSLRQLGLATCSTGRVASSKASPGGCQEASTNRYFPIARVQYENQQCNIR